MTALPHYCKPCGEMLADGQTVCPFCDRDSTPIDETNPWAGLPSSGGAAQSYNHGYDDASIGHPWDGGPYTGAARTAYANGYNAAKLAERSQL